MRERGGREGWGGERCWVPLEDEGETNGTVKQIWTVRGRGFTNLKNILFSVLLNICGNQRTGQEREQN